MSVTRLSFDLPTIQGSYPVCPEFAEVHSWSPIGRKASTSEPLGPGFRSWKRSVWGRAAPDEVVPASINRQLHAVIRIFFTAAPP